MSREESSDLCQSVSFRSDERFEERLDFDRFTVDQPVSILRRRSWMTEIL